MKKGVEVITDPEKAKILIDPMRREMMRLLASNPMTENELAKALGLSDPSIGYHLKILRSKGLIRRARKEVEEHGIVQKFYETTALACFIDSRIMPLEIERYFMPVTLERARGIVSALNLISNNYEKIPTGELEEFARVLSSTIMSKVTRFSGNYDGDREEMIGKIYHDALAHLVGKPDLLPGAIRSLLLRGKKARSKK